LEPLARSFPPQCAQMLATLQVPDSDGPVLPATGEPAAIGTHLERLYCPLMRLLHPHALPTLDLPPAYHPVTASTDHQLPARTPGHRSNHPRMPYKVSHARPAKGVPHHQFPAVADAGGRGKPPAIGAEGHAHDGPVMSRPPQ